MLISNLVHWASCLLFVPAGSLATKQHLTLTALLSNNDGDLRFECWSIDVPFKTYPTTGMAVEDFAEVTNVSYVVLPPRSSEGLHKPPHAMCAIVPSILLPLTHSTNTKARFFVLLSGLAHVTIPATGEELWISEGVNGLMVAADTVGKGHFTEYPLDKDTVALQIPFKDGKPPKYKLLHNGVCHANVRVPTSRDHVNNDIRIQNPI